MLCRVAARTFLRSDVRKTNSLSMSPKCILGALDVLLQPLHNRGHHATDDT